MIAYVYILSPLLDHEPLVKSDYTLDSLKFPAAKRVPFNWCNPLAIQSMYLKSAPLASPRCFLEMQNLMCHPRPAKSGSAF